MHKQFPNGSHKLPLPLSQIPCNQNLPATWLSLKRFAICGEPIEASGTIGYYS